MILKPSAENGASSFARRSSIASGPLFGLKPLIGGTSTGDGRYSTTASSSGCTPLFLKAEPQITGTKAGSALSPSVCTEEFTRLRSAALISSSEISSPWRYFSRILSSASLTFSISCSRKCFASSSMLAGISPTS